MKAKLLESILEYQFLQNALWASLLASIMCGIVGIIIMEKRLVMMSGGIAHTAYGGIGMGYYFGFEPILGALFISVLASLGIGTIKRKSDTQADILIGLFWSMGMALGIMFIAFTPGYPPDVTSYLFGNILSVRHLDLYFMLPLTIVVVFLLTLLFNYWKIYLFDEQFAAIRGVRVLLLENILYILIAFTVVVLIRVVGIILVLALLTAPPIIAAELTHNFLRRMLIAIFLGFSFCYVGLWLSYEFEVASGASIVLLAGVTYLVFISLANLFRRWRNHYARLPHHNST